MNQVTTHILAGVPVANARASAAQLADRVRETARALGCKGLWARAAGRHVILGIDEDEAFARVTPVGGGAYGLAFRLPCGEPSLEPSGERASVSRWAPLLLIDALADVVEHALVGEGAIHRRVHCM
jgi:hypothetical protein